MVLFTPGVAGTAAGAGKTCPLRSMLEETHILLVEVDFFRTHSLITFSTLGCLAKPSPKMLAGLFLAACSFSKGSPECLANLPCFFVYSAILRVNYLPVGNAVSLGFFATSATPRAGGDGVGLCHGKSVASNETFSMESKVRTPLLPHQVSAPCNERTPSLPCKA